MAQQGESGEGFMGTVRSYIPGMGFTQPETAANANTHPQKATGIFSYLPGFGGSSGEASQGAGGNGEPVQQQGGGGVIDSSQQHVGSQGGGKWNDGPMENAQAMNRSQEGSGMGVNPKGERMGGEEYNDGRHAYRDDARGDSFSFDNGSRSGTKSNSLNGGGDTNNAAQGAGNYDSSYQGAGTGTKYHPGREETHFAPQSNNQYNQMGQDNYAGSGTGTGNNQYNQMGQDNHAGSGTGTGNDDLARTNNPHNNYDNYSSQGGQQQGTDDGVRGAPIEGDGVKGYAMSAPVGSGDTNIISRTGEPSGQVSGAHMQYLPEDTDTRDQTGRGTVGRTTGEGDSSFANVKRHIEHGTEHVVTKSSQSHIEHTSTTQL